MTPSSRAPRFPPWLGVALALFGCATDDVVAFLGDGGVVSQDGGQAAFCVRTGPRVQVGDQRLACGARFFRYALCSCTTLSFSTAVTADAFDSRSGPYSGGGPGGSVASHGEIVVSESLDATGDVVAQTGVSGMGAAPVIRVDGLRSGGPIGGLHELIVISDARVAGDVSAARLTVGGTLTVPAGAVVSSLDGVSTLENAPVAVVPPCTCGDVFDVTGEVAAHRADNDNAAASLRADQLLDYGDETRLTLGCGRYYLDAIRGAGTLELILSGRTAIYVAGDVESGRELFVTLQGSAELDLFVGGTLVSRGPIRMGDASSAGRIRVFVGGTGSLNLTGPTEIAGHLYAPRANLQAAGPLVTYGSVFVGNLATAAPVDLHFDTASMNEASCP
ncbi:MAG: hypothetical protein AB8I08_03615 [Sandaracinaceae bacterium]